MARLRDGTKVPCEPDYPRRGPRCHAECEDYVKWQRRRFEELEEQNREKDTDYALTQMSQKWGDRRY